MKWKITLLMLVVSAGCKPVKNVYENQKWAPIYRVHVGLGKGGITENTDSTIVSRGDVDAFSGATRTSFNCGGKILLPLKRNSIETGIDFLQNSQTLNYNDNLNHYYGKRNIHTSQVMVPIIYNISLFRENSPLGLMQLKFGYLTQWSFFNINDSGENLPEYSTKTFSSGLVVGFSINPIKLKGNGALGFYLEGYRGTRIYEDFYNKKEHQMPGTSFFKYGIFYQF